VRGKRPRAIIVEDDPDILLILRNTLEDAGFETSLAADGSTAMRRIEAERPQVVLLDLMLPLMDGWSVLAELRERPDAPKVVVCTARVSRVERERAFEMGAVEYVTKPFDVDELVELVWNVVRRPAGSVEPPSTETGPSPRELAGTDSESPGGEPLPD
jgi:DNA-binding response OmpR family regulator